MIQKETDIDKCREMFGTIKNAKLKPAVAVMLALKGMDEVISDYVSKKSADIVNMLKADGYIDTLTALKE